MLFTNVRMLHNEWNKETESPTLLTAIKEWPWQRNKWQHMNRGGCEKFKNLHFVDDIVLLSNSLEALVKDLERYYTGNRILKFTFFEWKSKPSQKEDRVATIIMVNEVAKHYVSSDKSMRWDLDTDAIRLQSICGELHSV